MGRSQPELETNVFTMEFGKNTAFFFVIYRVYLIHFTPSVDDIFDNSM